MNRAKKISKLAGAHRGLDKAIDGKETSAAERQDIEWLRKRRGGK